MEVLNPTIGTRPRFFSTTSIIYPNYSITAWRKKNPYKFNIPNSQFPRHPPFPTYFPLSSTTKFRISAHFGRPTDRRNSLRKKLTEQQQQQQKVIYNPINPVRDNDTSEPYDSNLDNDSVEESIFNSNYGVNEGTVNSDAKEESKTMSKPFAESVLWNKLENWAEQYKVDSKFWGIGLSPIFTVFQDFEGNANRVVVHEDEILRRSGMDRALYKERGVEDLGEVDSKISHAKFIARETESGSYVFPKNSSVAKFVVSGAEKGFVDGIRGLNVGPGVSLKLPKIGILILCGFFVFWAMKTLFSGGKGKVEYTRLEKDMMKRKMKARKEKEKLVKGNVEVMQDPVESQMVSIERPRLNKEELMNSILEVSTGTRELQGSSSDESTSQDFDGKIQEIRAMAKHVREIEKRDPSPGGSEGEDDLTVSELSNQNEVVKQHGEGDVRLPNGLSNEYPSQTRGVNGPLEPTSFNDLKSQDTGFSEEAIAENSDRRTSILSREVSGDGESTIQDVVNQESGGNISAANELSQTSDTLRNQSSKLRKSFRTKARVICSVKEAREFLSRKREEQQPNQELQNRVVPEGALISSAESENKIGSNSRQRLGKDNEVSGTSGLNGASDSARIINACTDSVLKKEELVPTQTDDPEAAGDGHRRRVTGLPMPRALGQEANIGNTETGPSALALPRYREVDKKPSQGLDKDNQVFKRTIVGGPSDSASAASALGASTLETREDSDPEGVEEGYRIDDLQKPPEFAVHESNSIRTESIPSNKENWMEKHFHELEPMVKKIGGGFRDSYLVARDKVKQELDMNSEMTLPKSAGDNTELDWMKDDRLREIVFQVRENELAGHDPFYLMDEEDKLAFFEGLERKVEKENEKLSYVHEWLHSNIENLDYGADGISLYDPPEKIIPRWKGPPEDKISEFLSNYVGKSDAPIGINSSNPYIERKDGQNSLQKSKESPFNENILGTSEENNRSAQILNGASKRPKTVIEGSDGSVRAGKKSGKEYWQHTKKWSRGFLESYNAETDPEVKAIMKDIGKDLDRWITEKEIKEAAALMDKSSKRRQKFAEKKLNKVKREVEMFGPQAVVSKYREYADEKEEDYLWWLDLPFVLCIELYTHENGEQKTGFYSLEMAADLELDSKQYHVIAFEDPGDCKNLCYIIQAHMEMLGNGSAFVVARPPKDAFRDAKADGFSVTVIRKSELQLNVDQTLEEVEEQIAEIGTKIYHDKIMREQSMDLSSLTKGLLVATKPTKRRRSSQKLKKPTK